MHMHLKRLRELRGLNQDDLADMIGLTKSTVSRAESMHHTAKLATYRKCAEALGVSLADLFCDDLSPVERELLAVFRSTPASQRHVFAALIAQAKARDPASDQ